MSSNVNVDGQDIHSEKPDDDDVVEFEGIVIVGGGIAGLATATALHRVGLKSLVLERASSLRTTGAALTLMTNAWRALDALGVAHILRQLHPQLERAQVTSISSGDTKELSYRGTGKCGNHEVRCIQRRALLETLAKGLPPGTIRFNSKVASIRQSENSSSTIIELGNKAVIKAKALENFLTHWTMDFSLWPVYPPSHTRRWEPNNPRVLIGCDGVNSVVASWLGLQAPSLSGRSAIRGLATYPDGHNLEPMVQQYWGDGLRAGFVPCNDKDVYWFTTQNSLPQDSETGSDPKLIWKEALERLGEFPEQMVDIVNKAQVDTLTLTPLSLRWPWAVLLGRLCTGNVCVAGDAMHPMTPDLGQGGCAALEDSVVLGRCLGEAMTEVNALDEEKRIEEALKKFVKERRWRVFGLISGAYITGLVQQGSGGFIMRFIRDKILSKKLSENLLNQADFDCGRLSSSL
eukprot:Gb_21928 [translate_table: standard]